MLMCRPGQEQRRIHPLTIKHYFDHDDELRHTDSHRRDRIPIPHGYEEFAHFFNSISETKYKYRLTQYSKSAGKWVRPNNPIRPSAMTETRFLDPRYDDLRKMRLLTSSGKIDNRIYENIQNALYRPHAEQSKQQHFYERRREQQLIKQANREEQEEREERDGYVEDEGEYGGYLSDPSVSGSPRPRHRSRRSRTPTRKYRRSESPTGYRRSPHPTSTPTPSIPSHQSSHEIPVAQENHEEDLTEYRDEEMADGKQGEESTASATTKA
ncbi:hypothetical protein H0H93_016111 [Arthromyces matolae]|nr:hypothetical protein H0H93_016111 [Arthromyces matolae]